MIDESRVEGISGSGRRPTATVLAVGDKGVNFLRDIRDIVNIKTIISYGDSVARIRPLAAQWGVDLLVDTRPGYECLEGADVVLCVGWQYLIRGFPPDSVVLHDSLLPRYRGFAPTVAALIEGEREIGVSAILPGFGVDDGDVVAQERVRVNYPCKISEAFELLRDAYVQVTRAVVRQLISSGGLEGAPQDHSLATYSQWRDESDYFIDWSKDAEEIARFIDAVGVPYGGATTLTQNDETIVIRDSAVSVDHQIVQRTAGKLWALGDSWFEVVCGTGILRVVSAETPDGSAYVPRGLRTRLRRPCD